MAKTKREHRWRMNPNRGEKRVLRLLSVRRVLSALRIKITRRRILAIIEVTIGMFAIGLALFSFFRIARIEGSAPPTTPLNASFLELSDYPKALPSVFALRHDAEAILGADLFVRPQPPVSTGSEAGRFVRWLLPSFIDEPDASGPASLDLDLHPLGSDERRMPRRVAFHVPGTVDGIKYTVRRTVQVSEALELPPLRPSPAWAKGADVVISPENAPDFEGKLSMEWQTATIELGEGVFALMLPIGFFQNLAPEASHAQMTFLVTVQTPPGYALTSASYPLDEPERLHPQGAMNVFRVGPLFGSSPLVAVFAPQGNDLKKSSRLVLWSTLFGAAIGVMFEFLFSMVRSLARERP